MAGICARRTRGGLGTGPARRVPPRVRDDDARRGRATRRRPPLRAVRARRGVRAARDGRLLGRHAGRRATRATAIASAPCTPPPTPRRVRCHWSRSIPSLALGRCVPGGGGRGPMHQYAQLYRALLRGGELDGVRILSPQTVEAMAARHRVGLFDETYHVPCDWGLGVQVDAFAMGGYASPARLRSRRRAVVVHVHRPRARAGCRGADQRHVRQR